MADINFAKAPATSRTVTAEPAADDLDFELIELFFFAYRDFVAEPDHTLAALGYGRAHHRVLHFVNRKPGLRVTDLLEILRITKQSLGRVLKQLVDDGYIEQTQGPVDRRQRLLRATDKGRALALALSARQSARIAAALDGMPAGSRAAVRDFLDRMVDRTPYVVPDDEEA
jgi:DNA-binding MarR family transcriptional regulator